MEHLQRHPRHVEGWTWDCCFASYKYELSLISADFVCSKYKLGILPLTSEKPVLNDHGEILALSLIAWQELPATK